MPEKLPVRVRAELLRELDRVNSDIDFWARIEQHSVLKLTTLNHVQMCVNRRQSIIKRLEADDALYAT